MHCSIIPNHIFREIIDHSGDDDTSLYQSVLGFMSSLVADMGDSQEFNPFLMSGFINFVHLKREHKINRLVHDCETRQQIPGKLVRKEGDKPTKDAAVNEAYDHSGHVHTFFSKCLGRDSIDNNGMALRSNVNFGRNYPNAFWDGKQMTYGTGDGKYFNRFTKSLDVAGHEIAHGVVERTAGLVYHKQPGALNEHFADVFGSCVKQFSRKQTAKEADWIIGEGLFTDNVNGVGIRHMLHPGTAYDDVRLGKDRNVGHMKDYRDIEEDNGGVHIWSGIPNRAFANAAINMGGFAYDKPAKIWYHALTTKLKKNTQFAEASNMITQAAGELYGKNSIEQKAVRDGFELVGLKPKA